MKFVLPLTLLLSSIGSFDAFAPKALGSKLSSTKLFSSTDVEEKVVIVGGGIAGLSIAHYLATNSDKKVTLLDRTGPAPIRGDFETECSSSAAEGYLGQQFFGPNDEAGENAGPNAAAFSDEEYGLGILYSLCMESRDMYGEWINAVEKGAKTCEYWAANKYWWAEESELEPWEVGYRSEHDTIVAKSAGLNCEDQARKDALELQPFLNGLADSWTILDGYGSVDAQRLLCSLRAACAGAGVDMKFGEDWSVKSLLKDDEQNCIGVDLLNRDDKFMGSVVVATGPAFQDLIEDFDIVPIYKDKGDTTLLAAPGKKSLFMDQPVVSKDVSILSKPGGRVHLSSCQIEPNNDFEGDAEKLVPAVSLCESLGKIKSTRPRTADFFPILGQVDKDCGNLYVAGGFNTYGIMLAPKTGELIGKLIVGADLEEYEKDFLKACKPVRQEKEGPPSFDIRVF